MVNFAYSTGQVLSKSGCKRLKSRKKLGLLCPCFKFSLFGYSNGRPQNWLIVVYQFTICLPQAWAIVMVHRLFLHLLSSLSLFDLWASHFLPRSFCFFFVWPLYAVGLNKRFWWFSAYNWYFFSHFLSLSLHLLKSRFFC